MILGIDERFRPAVLQIDRQKRSQIFSASNHSQDIHPKKEYRSFKPQGFQAWMRFTANADRTKDNNECPSSQKAAAVDPDLGRQKVDLEAEVDWSAGVTWTMIAEELRDMPTIDAEEGTADAKIREVDLDLTKAASKLRRLCKTGVILQPLESSPSRDRVVSWVRETMSIRRGVRVVQVKALAKREFLIVFASEEGKGVAMTNPPCFLDGKVIRFVEWGNRHKEKLLPHLKAVWVELRDVPPFLEDQVFNMLAAIGSLAYQAVDKQIELRYANVRGCVLMDLAQELPKKVGLRTPWQKVYLQHITYTRLDHCFVCMQRGHWARNCPTRTMAGNREARQETAVGNRQAAQTEDQLVKPLSTEEEDANKEDEFIPVRGRTGFRSPRIPTRENRAGTSSTNRFDVLCSDDGVEVGGERQDIPEEVVPIQAEEIPAEAKEDKRRLEVTIAAIPLSQPEGLNDKSPPRRIITNDPLVEAEVGNKLSVEVCAVPAQLDAADDFWVPTLPRTEADVTKGQLAFLQEGLNQSTGPEDNLLHSAKRNPFNTGHSVLAGNPLTIQCDYDPLFIAKFR
ncbi:hypothetical protein R1sor_011929 [Riccia sorocarpa]|uniref:CCHC-type domain-containing protein n=1 Tax=Riccia sorocarpa TaxID=122646 RepID=A0ABD3I2Q9_9MARC